MVRKTGRLERSDDMYDMYGKDVNTTGFPRWPQAEIFHPGEIERYVGSAPKPPPHAACRADPLLFRCFRSYRTELEAWHEEQLDRLVIDIVSRDLEGKPVAHVLMIGHAAKWRASDDKFALGQGRAESVEQGLRRRLKLHGNALARLPITTLSLGDMLSEASNATQAGRSLNRRVSVKLLLAPPPANKTKCQAIADGSLREAVFAILGRRPERFQVAKELFAFIRRADSLACKALGSATGAMGPAARLACMFLNSFVETLASEFENDPAVQLAFVRGSAYALMDAATNRQRPLSRIRGGAKLVRAFSLGYRHTSGRLLALREDARLRPRLDDLLAAIACRDPRSSALRTIYLAILAVVRSESRSLGSNVFIGAAGNCAFDYPRIRHFNCGPLPD
jgi:hypothetical protein